MSARLAVHLSPHELPELQRAARALLRTPLTTTQHRDEFRLVCKWATVLRNEFGQKFGYRLDVSRTAARLLRRPASLTHHRGARLDSGREISRWGYVYLCLTLAALEQPGRQVIASELLTRITSLTRGDDRLRIDTTEYAQRRAFRDAVRYLEQIGVLTVRDGNVESLLSEGQVLWDLDRDAAAMCMVAAPSILRTVTSVADFLDDPVPTSAEGRSRRARQRLNRRLVDQPVVFADELDADEADLAWRNRRREADNVARLTGCEVELRREGMALIDHPTQRIGGQRFPGSDAVAHAALLWLSALVEHVDTTREADLVDDDDVEVEPFESSAHASAADTRVADGGGPRSAGDASGFVAVAIAERSWQQILDAYSNRLNQEARERPEAFRREVGALLERFGLAHQADGGIRVSAAASRYRAIPVSADAEPDEFTVGGESDGTDKPSPQQAMF